jgi:peptidoglycan/xylan/chitin deacetylase (PgdA/CDA1 family)
MSIKHTLKKAIYVGLYYSGLERILTRFLRVDAAVIIMYHGVAEQVSMPTEVNFHATGRELERQLRMLTRRYEVISMSELLGRLQAGAPFNKQVVLTFDDGYRNNLTLAAPVMRRYRTPFSVYLATSRIGSDRYLPLNEIYLLYARGKLTRAETLPLRKRVRTAPVAETRDLVEELSSRATDEDRRAVAESFAMLSWSEVRELAGDPLVEIGAHTHSHCNMAAEPPESQRQDLDCCRRAIEEHLGKPPRLFAYPFGGRGYHNALTRESVIRAGFACAITTEPGLVRRGTDPFTLPRLGNFNCTWFLACELLYFFARGRFNAKAQSGSG